MYPSKNFEKFGHISARKVPWNLLHVTTVNVISVYCDQIAYDLSVQHYNSVLYKNPVCVIIRLMLSGCIIKHKNRFRFSHKPTYPFKRKRQCICLHIPQ
jgi:hypothetical protein